MESKNLTSKLFEEMDRIRGLIIVYKALPKGVGTFGVANMENSIRMAEKSIANGNVIDMLNQYENLKKYN